MHTLDPKSGANCGFRYAYMLAGVGIDEVNGVYESVQRSIDDPRRPQDPKKFIRAFKFNLLLCGSSMPRIMEAGANSCHFLQP